jgi:hypothetical protein
MNAPTNTTIPDGGLSPEQARARRRIEAMRLGVVPDVADGSSPGGHDDLLATARRTLELTGEGRGGLQAFIGDYGVGKTHLLERIRAEALQRGFATARVVLDPHECAPSHPKRVYRRIAAGLTFPDTPRKGLLPLLERGLRNERSRRQFLVDDACEPRDGLEAGAHLYLTPALRYLELLTHDNREVGSHRPALDLMLRWLEGDPTVSNRSIDRRLRAVCQPRGQLYSLMDYRPWSRIYGYLLSGIARLARLAGYGGLAVVVDEAEFHAVLSSKNQGFAVEFFQALAWAAKSGCGLPFERRALDGGGLGILKRLPPSYDSCSNLYVAMAFTPAEDCRMTLERFVPSHWCRDVERLEVRRLRELTEPLVDDFISAHPGVEFCDVDRRSLESLVEELAEAGDLRTPRDATRFIVGMLDIARFGDFGGECERVRSRHQKQSWGWR